MTDDVNKCHDCGVNPSDVEYHRLCYGCYGDQLVGALRRGLESPRTPTFVTMHHDLPGWIRADFKLDAKMRRRERRREQRRRSRQR